jgi:hypothetical protein
LRGADSQRRKRHLPSCSRRASARRHERRIAVDLDEAWAGT